MTAEKKVAQHTPGPWVVFEGGGRDDDNEKRFSIIGGCGCCGSPWVNSHDDKQETSEANARLIAAAPDLLVALEPFVGRNSSEESITITVPTQAIDRARAAIRKATGVA